LLLLLPLLPLLTDSYMCALLLCYCRHNGGSAGVTSPHQAVNKAPAEADTTTQGCKQHSAK
jgi:hypothetical protein